MGCLPVPVPPGDNSGRRQLEDGPQRLFPLARKKHKLDRYSCTGEIIVRYCHQMMGPNTYYFLSTGCREKLKFRKIIVGSVDQILPQYILCLGGVKTKAFF